MSAKSNILFEVLTLVLIIRLGSSTTLCENQTICNQMSQNTKCCNGICVESCNITTGCEKDNDCTTGEKCCNSGKCIPHMSLCSLSSKLAIAVPLSLLFSFVLLNCICANHSSCPVYANQQRRRLGVVWASMESNRSLLFDSLIAQVQQLVKFEKRQIRDLLLIFWLSGEWRTLEYVVLTFSPPKRLPNKRQDRLDRIFLKPKLRQTWKSRKMRSLHCEAEKVQRKKSQYVFLVSPDNALYITKKVLLFLIWLFFF